MPQRYLSARFYNCSLAIYKLRRLVTVFPPFQTPSYNLKTIWTGGNLKPERKVQGITSILLSSFSNPSSNLKPMWTGGDLKPERKVLFNVSILLPSFSNPPLQLKNNVDRRGFEPLASTILAFWFSNQWMPRWRSSN